MFLFTSVLNGKCLHHHSHKKNHQPIVESNGNNEPIVESTDPIVENKESNIDLIADGETGYCTYHNYYPTHSMMIPACSDGENGINTRWGYDTLSPMYPYVTAFSKVEWNNPTCGECVKVSSNSNTIYLTIIDQCGNAKHENHFDIAPEAFYELFGDQGIHDGHGYVEWEFESDKSKCKGNLG